MRLGITSTALGIILADVRSLCSAADGQQKLKRLSAENKEPADVDTENRQRDLLVSRKSQETNPVPQNTLDKNKKGLREPQTTETSTSKEDRTLDVGILEEVHDENSHEDRRELWAGRKPYKRVVPPNSGRKGWQRRRQGKGGRRGKGRRRGKGHRRGRRGKGRRGKGRRGGKGYGKGKGKGTPTPHPTLDPTLDPTYTSLPTMYPTLYPTMDRSSSPSASPSESPSAAPLQSPSASPSVAPSPLSSASPSSMPSVSASPSKSPSTAPSSSPSASPSSMPTGSSGVPSPSPSASPSEVPSSSPSAAPSPSPSGSPSESPSISPTGASLGATPTAVPTTEVNVGSVNTLGPTSTVLASCNFRPRDPLDEFYNYGCYFGPNYDPSLDEAYWNDGTSTCVCSSVCSQNTRTNRCCAFLCLSSLIDCGGTITTCDGFEANDFE